MPVLESKQDMYSFQYYSVFNCIFMRCEQHHSTLSHMQLTVVTNLIFKILDFRICAWEINAILHHADTSTFTEIVINPPVYEHRQDDLLLASSA